MHPNGIAISVSWLHLSRDNAPTYWLSGFPTSMSWYILNANHTNRASDLHKIAGKVEDIILHVIFSHIRHCMQWYDSIGSSSISMRESSNND